MKRKLTAHFATLVFGLFIGFSAIAQTTADDFKKVFKFSTIKQADNTRLLEVSFVAQNKEDRKDQIAVFEAEISFYNVLDSTQKKLGVAKTDQDGLAQLTLPENQKYLVDPYGYMHFKAVFRGQGDMGGKSSELAVRDIFLKMTLEIVDSVKTVSITAQTFDSTGAKIDVPEADVVLSVGGLISKMPIAQETLEEGSLELEFPEDIPGDKNGMINVYVTIDEHEEYGSVVQMQPADWGTFDTQKKAVVNQLWSEAAPIWMYVLLAILLIGVWANYAYTAYNLFKIKKEGQAADLNDE